MKQPTLRITYSMNNFGLTTKFIWNVASSISPIVTTSSVSPSLTQQPPRTGVTQRMFRSKRSSSRDTLILGYQPHSVVRNGHGGKDLEVPCSWCRCLSSGKLFQMSMSQHPPLKYGNDTIKNSWILRGYTMMCGIQKFQLRCTVFSLSVCNVVYKSKSDFLHNSHHQSLCLSYWNVKRKRGRKKGGGRKEWRGL